MSSRRGAESGAGEMSQYELETRWAARDPSLAVAYRFGDAVRIKEGGHAGREGRVVALVSVEPRPTYYVELPEGDSARALEPDLEMI